MPSHEGLSLSKHQQRKWRMAIRAIHFTMIILSSNKLLDDKNGVLLRSLSHVAIEIQNENPTLNNPVSFRKADKTMLTEIVRCKSLESLSNLGGVRQVIALLESNPEVGISCNEAHLTHRRNVFGVNRYQKQPVKTFPSFSVDALKDKTIIALLVCAVFSLGFGIKQQGWMYGSCESAINIAAVLLAVAVSAVSNFMQNRRFQKLLNENRDIKVEVARDGRNQIISVFDVVVGDIVYLKIGDQIPADGLFLNGQSLKLDESSMSGESDHVEINESDNPFLLSGTKVTDGYGTMLVTSVGKNTAWGEMTSSISHEVNYYKTPLQARINKLIFSVGMIGLAAALLFLFIGYNVGNREFNDSKSQFDRIKSTVVHIAAAAVTIVVVAIPEGLPSTLAVTLAYSMNRMMADQAVVRRPSACEKMGTVTTICTNKTGILTLNEMKVTKFWLGKEAVEDPTTANIAPNVRELLQEGVCLNTVSTIHKSNSGSLPDISDSLTEIAMISWSVTDRGMNVDKLKQQCEIIQVRALSSEKKISGVLMRRINENSFHTHWKGAAETILPMCSDYYDRSGTMKPMDDQERLQIGTIIKGMEAKDLRCVAFAHTKVANVNGEIHDKLEASGLTMLGLVGLTDPCLPGVRTAVESCRKSGVNVKMITEESTDNAVAIAVECGILNPDIDLNYEAVVEGVQFRNYRHEDRMEKIDNIRVMARCSASDRLLIVQSLKQKDQVVAVIGDGTNDAPALKEADIGLSMAIQGTEVAKESSDIVILDDNFTSVVKSMRWGRCVYSKIQKSLEFQLTARVAALVINFVAAISSGEAPLTSVQLPFVNLLLDPLGLLALAGEQPAENLMTKPPVGVGGSKPLITKVTWRNIISQAVYQVIAILTIQFKGRSMFDVNEKIKQRIVFNTFVLCQVFNEFNAGKLEKNIFKGIHKNKLFLAYIGLSIIVQVVTVEILLIGNTESLNWGQWAACIGIASITWPIGFLIKLIVPVPA